MQLLVPHQHQPHETYRVVFEQKLSAPARYVVLQVPLETSAPADLTERGCFAYGRNTQRVLAVLYHQTTTEATVYAL